MYSLKAILQKQPVAIAAALKTMLFVGVLLGLIALDEKALAGIAIAVEVVLNLFVFNASTPTVTAKVNEAQAFAQGQTYAPPS